MAQRLEGRKFVLGYNAGVWVIAPLCTVDASWDDYGRVPVFTFVKGTRLLLEDHFTGHKEMYENLKRWIVAEGGEIVGGTAIYVPFCNTPPHTPEGERSLRREKARFETSEADFEREFGITPLELARWASPNS